MLKFLEKKWKRQVLVSLSSDPLPEGQPVDRDSFFCLSKEIKRVSVRKLWKIDWSEFQDNCWQSPGIEGVAADAKAITVTVTELSCLKFKTVSVTVILRK